MKIRIDDIIIKQGRRTLRHEHIRKVADSISELGLLNPITVDSNHVLIAGFHRLEAAKMLGWTEIECVVSELDELRAEMAEIDENYIRLGLNPVEQADLLLRRKEIYEELHPETKCGISQVNGMKRVTGEAVTDNLSATAKTFAEDTADKLGVNARTVRRQVQMAKNMIPEAKEVLKASENKITQQNALKLSKLAPECQKEAANLLAAGHIHSVDEYRSADTVEKTKPKDEAFRPKISDSTFAAIVADLKNHDKDTSANPEAFIMQYTSFTRQFTQNILWYGEEYFRPVFPLLSDAQMDVLRNLTEEVCDAAEEMYAQIEEMRKRGKILDKVPLNESIEETKEDENDTH